MKSNLPLNVIRYVTAAALIQYFVKELLSPHYPEFVVKGTLSLSREQLGLFLTVSASLALVLMYFGGILTDKYGRRRAWAVSLFLYGGGILWMAISGSFTMVLVAAGFIGISSAFKFSATAWLFDSEGKEGLRKAYGLLYIISLPLTLAGMKAVTRLGDFLDDTSVLLVAAVIILVIGWWVITFPGPYGYRHDSCRDIAKSGIHQVVSSRVLQLIVLQSIFMGFPAIVSSMWDLYFLEKFHEAAIDLFPQFRLISLVAAFCAGIFVLLKKTNYRYFIIYPLGFTAVFFVAIPFAPTWLVYILIGGISAGFLIEGAGLFILINDSIFEDRATALSLMGVLTGISGTVGHFLWTQLFAAWEEKFLLTFSFPLAAAFIVVSILLLFWALKMHEKEKENKY